MAASGFDALLKKPNNGTLTTSLGRSIPLPANFSAAIPRASATQAAVKLLRSAGPYGLAAFGLYQLLSPLIRMHDDGSVDGVSTPPDTCQNDCQPKMDSCLAHAAAMNKSAYAPYSSLGYTTSCTDQPASHRIHELIKSSGGGTVLSQYWLYTQTTPESDYCQLPSIYDATTKQCTGVPTQLTDSELQQKINDSAASSPDLVQKTLDDAVSKNIDLGDSSMISPSSQVAVEASPFTSPSEEISRVTSPNPDGSTSTAVKNQTVTATPQPSGSTAADASVTWNVSTTTTTTTTNNTTNITTTTTEINNLGNQTEPKGHQSDLCTDHPDVLACQTLDAVPPATPETVPNQNVGDFAMPVSVSGSCPAPYTQTLTTGQNIAWSYEPVCTFGSSIRPVVIALALLAAAYIVSGAVRSPA